MSAILERAVAAANLDLLLLGALADRVRSAERGEVVRLHLDRPAGDDGVRLFGADDLQGTTTPLELVRRVAEARLAGARVIRVDAEALGLPLAQMALAFGADEIIAPVRVNKLALELYDESRATPEAVLRERELCALIRAARRIPRIVEHERERDPDETTIATRKFRAPGRDKPAGEVGA